MFSIHISEKDGGERSETFHKAEITVGRVEGNDLMLPKGNVSKRHAKLACRDGRFILTDLKSTNGTYVNGRRIAQATIVREGDSIHVGDFVLRLGALAGISSGLPAPEGPPYPTREMPGRSAHPTVLAETMSTPPSGRSWLGADAPLSERGEERASHGPVSTRPHPSLVGSLRPPLSPMPRPSSVKPTLPPSERPFQDGYGRALAILVSRISKAEPGLLAAATILDEASLNRLSRTIAELARGLRESGEIPSTIDEAALSRDVHRELLDLGPLRPLLEDDAVSEIRVLGPDRIVALRGSQMTLIDPAFSSESALHRIVGRLCEEAGRPLAPGEGLVERVLPGGLFMQAMLPPIAVAGPVLVLRKPRRAEPDLDELVREGTLSRAMATFLSQAVAMRANLLIVTAAGEACDVGSALVRADDSHAVTLHPAEQPSSSPSPATAIALPDLGARGAKVTRAAVRLLPERLVVSPFAGQVAAEVLDAIAEGTRGVISILHAPSLRLGLERLPPDLAAARPGLSTAVAREWLAASFDLVVEVARLRDGRHRVLRIGELVPSGEGALTTRDAFTFSIERMAMGGDVEGSFSATGLVPRVVEDGARRGEVVDMSLFRKLT